MVVSAARQGVLRPHPQQGPEVGALEEYGYEVDGDLAELDVLEEDARVQVPFHVLGGQKG